MSPKQNIVGDICGISDNVTEIKERNYMDISSSTSTESSTISNIFEEILSLKANDMGSNFMETELTLGLPGSGSPENDLEHCQLSTPKLDDKLLLPMLNINCLSSQKTIVSGQKRGFSVGMIEFSERKYASNSEVSPMPSTGNTIDFSTKSINGEMKEPVPRLLSQEQTYAANKSCTNYAIALNNSGEPPAKVQVIGWPPIRSFRKNTKVVTKEEEEEDMKKMKGLYIKVSMDGAPYLRKVDLRAYSAYRDLSTGLKNMFSCFTLGRYGSHGAAKEITNEGRLKHLLHGCEYVLTYEDKDGDLMLLGDVPWEMFVDTCKRLRIMKGLEVISLAPTAMEKCQNQS